MPQRLFSFLCIATLLTYSSCSQPETDTSSMDRPEYALVIHGGAGTILKANMSDSLEAEYISYLQKALDTGEAILKDGGSAMDAAEATIRVMEDAPLFNSGKGAVFTHEETVELDASFMDGKSLNAGAVSGVKIIRNPITLARKVMDNSVHVMLSGVGAEEFGIEQGLDTVPNDYFYTPRRLQQLQKSKITFLPGDPDPSWPDKKFGTVGALALDKEGNLAAGTSTGGMTNKRYGRIGDSPIIGAGTYANNATCAVSCTGHGEFFIRYAVAHDVSARMAYKGIELEQAALEIIAELKEKGGSGGLVALDANGNVAMPFNTEGMYRGYVKSDGSGEILIYK